MTALATIIIPVLNEEKRLPLLFTSLDKVIPASCEILFVNNASTDNSKKLIGEFIAHSKLHVRLVDESVQGFPEPLRRGVSETTADKILFLDADCLPTKNWAERMITGLDSASIVVGETENKIRKAPSDAERLAADLFHGYSEFCALARGHALPWGPACNLGVRRSCFENVGEFSSAAGSAFDIDWCWRAILAGETLSYLPKAKVQHRRRVKKSAFLEQMHRYGLGEAWLRHAFQFLDEQEARKPEHLAMDAFRRLSATKLSADNPLLAEAAAANAIGVIHGEMLPRKICKETRAAPPKAISWTSGKDEITVYVPGRGVTTLAGPTLLVWHAWQSGATEKKIASMLAEAFELAPEEAAHEAAHFVEAFEPA